MKLEVFSGNKNPFFQDAKKLREQIFVQEQKFHDEFDEIDESCLHYVLYDDLHQAMATARSFPSNTDKTTWIIGRVAVSFELRGQKIGQKIMNLVLEDLKKRNAQQVELSAQSRASGFYEKLGFRLTGEEHMDEYCPHVTMTLSLLTK